MQLIVIASFMAIYIHDFLGQPAHGGGDYAAHSGTFLFLALAILTGVSWLVSLLSTRSLDRRGDFGAFTWNEISLLVLQIIACIVFYFAVLVLGWLDFIRSITGDLILVDELLSLLPLLLFVCLLWWGAYPVERRWYDALFNRWLYTGRPLFMPPTRNAFVIGKVRHTILFFAVPLALLMGWRELSENKVVPLLGIDAAKQPLSAAMVQLGGVAVILTLVPLVLVMIWDTVPLGAGTLRDRLVGICSKYRVGVRDLLVWRTHGTMANGAALGFFRPVRFVLLTDQLLESLPIPQVEAVMAHEVAHIKHRHILWLSITVIATLVFTGGFFETLARLVGPPSSQLVANAIVSLSGIMSIFLVFLAFGWVSRRFEWQADAFAARHMAGSLPAPDQIGDAHTGEHSDIITPVAIASMSQALSGVAELNGTSIRRPDFRHGSIYSRQIRLRDLVGLPRSEFPIDRLCRRIKIAVCIALALGIGLSILHADLTPEQSPDDNTVTSQWDSLSTNFDSAK